MKTVILALAFVLAAPLAAHAQTYDIDPAHSHVGFDVKHMMISTVHGRFNTFSGTATLDDAHPAKDKLEVSVDTASIDTDQPKRDAHLKSADFFDVAQFPKMTFVSKKVKSAGKGKLTVTGDLTLHGVTKSVVLHVTDLSKPMVGPDKKMHRGASATATINRQDFGIKWNKSMGAKASDVMVGDEVKIIIDVELVQK